MPAVPGPVRHALSGNVPDILVRTAAAAPERVVSTRPDGTDVTAAGLLREVTAVARGLVAAGVAPGDRVAVLCGTRHEWTVADFAVLCAGGVAVPLHPGTPAARAAGVMRDCGVVAAVTETPAQAALVTAAAGLPPARVWCVDAGGLRALARAGAAVPEEEVVHRRSAAGPGTLGVLAYTSGTTGPPRGCLIRHGGLVAQVRGVVTAVGPLDRLGGPEGTASTVLSLPTSGMYGRVALLFCLATGVRVTYCRYPGALPRLLREVRPTVLMAVPRFYRDAYERARRDAHARGLGRLFDAAAETARAHAHARERNRPGLVLTLRHAWYDRLVFRRMRAALGGRVGIAMSSGDALGRRLGLFLHGAGVPVWEAYGLTETSGAACVSLPVAARIGSAGRALPGVEVRVDDDGEVLIAGETVFGGYWNEPAATVRALSGIWLRTGDLGRLDAEGFLHLTGRRTGRGTGHGTGHEIGRGTGCFRDRGGSS